MTVAAPEQGLCASRRSETVETGKNVGYPTQREVFGAVVRNSSPGRLTGKATGIIRIPRAFVLRNLRITAQRPRHLCM